MNNQLIGYVRDIQETKVISEKFSVQSVIIETDDKYPQHMPIQFVNDQINLVNRLNIGDKVEFNININGREYANKKTGEIGHFISLQCWSFNLLGQESVPNVPNSTESQILEEGVLNSEDDDFPF